MLDPFHGIGNQSGGHHQQHLGFELPKQHGGMMV